jgi:hypothetical protein
VFALEAQEVRIQRRAAYTKRGVTEQILEETNHFNIFTTWFVGVAFSIIFGCRRKMLGKASTRACVTD